MLAVSTLCVAVCMSNLYCLNYFDKLNLYCLDHFDEVKKLVFYSDTKVRRLCCGIKVTAGVIFV